MAKVNNRTQELFKAKLAARKKETEEKTVVENQEKSLTLPNNNMEKIFQIPTDLYNDLTDDKNLIEFLNKKTLELLTINGAGNIIIGKELTEVFEKLAGQGKDGLYTRFLLVSGYKQDTALRYRKRYELYKKASNNSAKHIISIMPVKTVEKLYKEQELLEKIDVEGIEYQAAVDIINKKVEPLLIEESPKEELVFEMEELTFLQTQIKEKYDNLNQKEKNKLNKLLCEIKSLLEK
ncbi:hypothetical protein [Fusobacterium sp.]|uniref:hypothetical protein n=1 Tax=Fusobacterium sp. TaxID=68766 RepID=UPI002E785A9B|nr:hypothetical protein [Fusobacterium sp.]MEE1475419.1 hypothetical protein [Fusobacterium sp.]